ncbi:myo-inosose-2 dehydratase [Citrobacter sp. JGM124]|uniref:myo-inosose-2 dehydratase n=1 Tax=Citrobacter sp. JGM124 TaxID=2799789 RepID=UPI001BA711A7|nr:myo-inosose-2 dehydratase [Citrobacter sp. JGM124]MBS0847826.1 myo-inosose-2 dehydratase [Citrobacter sp. JGM124]
MNADKVKLAIAPIGWTNDDMPELGKENTFQQCISEMALAGFQGSEVGSQYPRDPARLKPALAMRGLQICNAWFSTYFADGQKEKTLQEFDIALDFLHEMGAKVIGCSEQSGSIQGLPNPISTDKVHFNDTQWQRTVEGYNLLAERAGKKGMRVCLHHHMGTAIQTPSEIDRFMESVHPEVGLLFDTGHIYCSERNQAAILAILEKYLPRIFHVHLKDCRDTVLACVDTEKLSFLDGVRRGMFTVPGDGVIEFKPIFDYLDKMAYQGWMVVEAEQDPAKANPLEYALKARKYLRETAGI